MDDECGWERLPLPPPLPAEDMDMDMALADVDPTDIVDDLRLALRKRLVMALATTLRRALTVWPSM